MRRFAIAVIATVVPVLGLVAPTSAQTPDIGPPWRNPKRPPVCSTAQVVALAIDDCVLYASGRPVDRGFSEPPFPVTPPWNPPVPTTPELWSPVGKGARGPIVTLIQQALVDDAAADLIVDGIFGTKTETAVIAYQTATALPATGVVDAATATALGVLVTIDRAPFPPDQWAWRGWGYNASPILATWEQQMVKNAVAIGPIPVNGLTAQRDVMPLFQGFLQDLVAGGYQLKEWGAYTFRCTSTTRKDCYQLSPAALSFHAWGAAIDINWSANPQKQYSSSGTYPNACAVPLVTDMPQWVVRAAERWGLYWLGYGGAACDNPAHAAASVMRDVMHFEYRSTPDVARAIAARNATLARPDWITNPVPTTTTTVAPASTDPATTVATTTAPAVVITAAKPSLVVPVKRGNRAPAVRQLQQALVGRGYRLKVDGVFGWQTQSLVRAVQKKAKQRTTGIVDAKLATFLGFVPVAAAQPQAVPSPTTAPAAPSPSSSTPPSATTPPSSPPTGATLTRGMRGPKVTAAQQALKAKGATLVVDGIFGAGTQAAVVAFQKANRISATGMIGPLTAAALGITL